MQRDAWTFRLATVPLRARRFVILDGADITALGEKHQRKLLLVGRCASQAA